MEGVGLAWLVWLGLAGLAGLARAEDGQCQEISIPMCKEIGYNYTRLPNQFNHETQDEAGLEVHQFWPLVKIQCSPDLRFFLCSMYTPICMESYARPLPACRSVCERAKLGCLPVMQKYGFEWPQRMSCARLPEYGGAELCMDSRAKEADTVAARPTSAAVPGRGGCGAGGSSALVQLRPGDALYNTTSVSWAGQPDCAAPCHSPFFSSEDREFTELWLSVWAVLCCLSTATTFSTFLMEPGRFHYPERPIMYLSLCYLLVSVGYLVRVWLGGEAVSCQLVRPGQPPGYTNPLVARVGMPASGTSELAVPCTTVFVLIYFFSMASSVWWVVLTGTWFLSAGLKWAQESISQYSTWYHCLAWLLPALQTLAVLARSAVEGDPVSGLCWVGTRNPHNMIAFVIAPLLLYLLLGVSFLAAGFISLFKIRNVIKEQGGRAKLDKLEKLMVKIGIFSVLYIVPAGTVIACVFYELASVRTWEISYLCPSCLARDQLAYPDFSVLMLKYFMNLAVGITSGFWVWSGKTVEAWRSCCTRLCRLSLPGKEMGRGGRRELPGPPPAPPSLDSGGPHYSTIPASKQLPLSRV